MAGQRKHDYAEVLRLHAAGLTFDQIDAHLGMPRGAAANVSSRHSKRERERVPYQIVIDRQTGEIVSSRGVDLSDLAAAG